MLIAQAKVSTPDLPVARLFPLTPLGGGRWLEGAGVTVARGETGTDNGGDRCGDAVGLSFFIDIDMKHRVKGSSHGLSRVRLSRLGFLLTPQRVAALNSPSFLAANQGKPAANHGAAIPQSRRLVSFYRGHESDQT